MVHHDTLLQSVVAIFMTIKYIYIYLDFLHYLVIGIQWVHLNINLVFSKLITIDFPINTWNQNTKFCITFDLENSKHACKVNKINFNCNLFDIPNYVKFWMCSLLLKFIVDQKFQFSFAFMDSNLFSFFLIFWLKWNYL